MRHTYECPLRWADMDLLGHVNNVTYVDYLQEARVDMFATHADFSGGEALAEGVVVVSHQVEFVHPLVFRRLPVKIDTWVTRIRAGAFTMAYEIYDDTEDGRLVHLRASSELAPYVFASESPRRISPAERAVLERFLEPADPRAALPRDGASRDVYDLKVRFSDVDVYRHVNNVMYFEYLQEARIHYLMAMHHHGEEWSQHVVARTDVRYRRPILFRHEPYAVHSWISRVGNSSFTLAAEIRDPLAPEREQLLASGETVMVTFDSKAQRSRPMPDVQREALLRELA